MRRASTPTTSSTLKNAGGASPRTSSAPRLRPLHEDLIERGKMYEHRKEAMREHALHKELAQCRAVPKVSPMARAIQREPGRIIKRLYSLAEEREKLREYKYQALEKEDEARLGQWFKPSISSLGNRANTQTKAVRHQQWEAKKQERLAEHRRSILLKELQHVRQGPEINPRSEALAARAREREGLGNLSHIEAMMERDRMAQLQRWENEQRHLSDEAPGTPRITAMAARMHAKTDIFDRLYAMTPPRYSSRKEAPNPDDLVNDVTRPFQQHTPVITAEAIKRFSTDGGLLERQEAYLQKKNERLRKAQDDEDRRHNPQIDRMSARIAAALPETSETRLTNAALGLHSSQSSARRLASPGASLGRGSGVAASYSRQNTSDGNQGQHAHPNAPSTATANELAVYERAVVAEMRRQQRLQKAREEHRQKQLQECTFQPETTGAAAKVVGPAATPLERMAQRSAEWARKRDDKLSSMRSEEGKKETEDCTFQPQIAHPQLRQFDSPLYGGDGKPWGVNEYIQRQDAARRIKEEREGAHLAVNSGSISARPTPPAIAAASSSSSAATASQHHYNQQLQNFTTPRGPNLGNHPPANIPSLDPPVRPPSHNAAALAPSGRHEEPSGYNSTAAAIANQYLRQ